MKQHPLRASFKQLILLVLLAALANGLASCVKLSRHIEPVSDAQSGTISPHAAAGSLRLNINRAAAPEFEKLPGIGHVIAARIVSYREHNGPFRRAEHLMMVRGFSDQKFRAIRHLVTVE